MAPVGHLVIEQRSGMRSSSDVSTAKQLQNATGEDEGCVESFCVRTSLTS